VSRLVQFRRQSSRQPVMRSFCNRADAEAQRTDPRFPSAPPRLCGFTSL
jgi:hypothetical protein